LTAVGRASTLPDMMPVAPDMAAVREAFERQSNRIARLLDGADRLDVAVPGLDWTAAQLAAHLCVVYESFAATVRGEFPAEALDAVPGRTDGATLPQTVAAVNAFAVAQLDFADPASAATRFAAAAAGLLSVLDKGPDPEAACPAPWYGPGMTRTVGTLAALAVSESLLHGLDLARALGGRERLCPRCAAAAAPTVMSQMMPLLLDRESARGFTGSFELRLRGGSAFTLHIADGRAWATGPGGAKPDCVLSLDPGAALAIGSGRRSLARAVLTGQAVAYGRKPWLGLRMGALFLNP
jgi:uncharacterized protein (TIGR03083 family)